MNSSKEFRQDLEMESREEFIIYSGGICKKHLWRNFCQKKKTKEFLKQSLEYFQKVILKFLKDSPKRFLREPQESICK